MRQTIDKISPVWKLMLVFMLMVFVLSGCNWSNQPDSAEPTLEYIVTQMQATLDQMMSETSVPVVINTQASTNTPEATATSTTEPTQTLEPTVTGTSTPVPTNTVVYVAPAYTSTPTMGVTVSSTSLARGESFTVTVHGFATNADIDLWLYEVDTDSKKIYDGKTDSTGAYSMTMTIPASANEDESWVVYVRTTEITPQQTATSATITIEESSTGNGEPVVYLSSTSLAAGDTFTVTVSGYPASNNIDFKLSNSDGSAIVYADGVTDSTGAASKTMTIPGSASSGESWKVTVYTTDLVAQVSATSSTITIK